MDQVIITKAQRPSRTPLIGQFVRLEPLDIERHARDLYNCLQADNSDEKLWNYLPYGPFSSYDEMYLFLKQKMLSEDPFCYAIVNIETDKAEGWGTYLRVTPEHGTTEIGNLAFSDKLQRTPKATEAIYLMGKNAMETLGNRRLEWKCNNENARSKNAALRFGFTFEGVFRKHMIVKGKNRDTAWFSITDEEWPTIAKTFEQWLSKDNFDNRVQKKSLKEIREAIMRE